MNAYPKYTDQEYYDRVARGLVPGAVIWRAMGERENMGATADIRTSGEDVWRGNDSGVGGGVYIAEPAITGVRMEVISSSVEDMPSAILTFTGNASDGETVTVGTKVYTFQAVLTNVDGNVLIGATTEDTISNFEQALYPYPNGEKGIAYATLMSVQPESILAGAAENNTIVFSIGTGTPASTTTITNASFDVANMVAKTGTACVEIEYLDGDGNEQEEVITMNGTTLVLTTFTDGIFVNDFYSRLSESTGKGNITVRLAGGASTDIYNMLGIGQNKSLVPKRMVPKGKSLVLKGWDSSEVQAKRLIYRIRATVSHGIRVQHTYHFIDNMYIKSATSSQLALNELIPEFSIITISGWADQSAAEGSCSWWGVLKDNH